MRLSIHDWAQRLYEPGAERPHSTISTTNCDRELEFAKSLSTCGSLRNQTFNLCKKKALLNAVTNARVPLPTSSLPFPIERCRFQLPLRPSYARRLVSTDAQLHKAIL
jgi:hypothetical protein